MIKSYEFKMTLVSGDIRIKIYHIIKDNLRLLLIFLEKN